MTKALNRLVTVLPVGTSPYQIEHVNVGTTLDVQFHSDICKWGSKNCIVNNSGKESKLKIVDEITKYYVEHTGWLHFVLLNNDLEKIAELHLLVDPVFSIAGAVLHVQHIICQTVLVRCLGPLAEWDGRISVAVGTGYNMIHFSPVQSLGLSQSAYSILDQLQLNKSINASWEDLSSFIKELKSKRGVLSITDLVLNHTATESEWLQEHPNCAYNLINAPYLRPAYLLDRIIWHLNKDIAEQKYESIGLSNIIENEQNINNICNLVWQILDEVKLHEFFLFDVDKEINKWKLRLEGKKDTNEKKDSSFIENELKSIPCVDGRRFGVSMDLEVACSLYSDENLLREKLESLNNAAGQTVQHHLQSAVGNIAANIRYRFLDASGPRISAVSVKDPLMFNYFTQPKPCDNIKEEEESMYASSAVFCMAHNGWVMDHDPLHNFAESDSNVYLRRELIPWGDSVKLRYGNSPKDCPYLWEHMKKYAEITAKIFDGIRLDNCHSTPIHVAKYLLEAAHKVNSNLLVVAELFTSNEELDNHFIQDLGINLLIREAMSANSGNDLGRLVHRFGGQPIASFAELALRNRVMSTVAPAIFYDQTHDNPSSFEKRSQFDCLASAAMVSMAHTAIGSCRGYDELVPHHVNVVTEERLYKSWRKEKSSQKNNKEKASQQSGKQKPGQQKGKEKSSQQRSKEKQLENHVVEQMEVGIGDGILAAKKLLNKLHVLMAREHYNQIYVDQLRDDVTAVTRFSPESLSFYTAIVRTAFSADSMSQDTLPHGFTFTPNGLPKRIYMESWLTKDTEELNFERDGKYINGLKSLTLHLSNDKKCNESELADFQNGVIEFKKFPPGAILIFRSSVRDHVYEVLRELRNNITAEAPLDTLSLQDIGYILFTCHEEGNENGFGAYYVPNFGGLTYCGLQGVVSLMSDISANNDLAHPLCNNIRDGDWLLDYLCARLLVFEQLHGFAAWFSTLCSQVKLLPTFLKPFYLDMIVTHTYLQLVLKVWREMPSWLHSSELGRSLSLASLQFTVCSKKPLLSNHLYPDAISISAGLPHFATGLFRNWGRDTFISLPGLLLHTGRLNEARDILLAYASCLRHGLIPNLLDGGECARFNGRDAVWWWLRALRLYCGAVGNNNLMQTLVTRIFPSDHVNDGGSESKLQKLEDLVQEIMEKCAMGTSFRERNAGPSIDEHMSDEGFNVTHCVDWTTGFVTGGSASNCGTWMDKMGSAGSSRGLPATPRDGAAIELVALCHSAATWLAQLHATGEFPYAGVQHCKEGTAQVKVCTFESWARLIKENFEKCFWNAGDCTSEQFTPAVVEVYKDSYGSSSGWTDHQFRPNCSIAMAIAPELFDPDHAWKCLKIMEDRLMGPLGMKTLDPSDWAYNGNYESGGATHGFNYHQGPEWVWPVGFFLRAKLHFASKRQDFASAVPKVVSMVNVTLENHRHYMDHDNWKSLPELTNQNGAICQSSCPAQAWSIASLIELQFSLSHC